MGQFGGAVIAGQAASSTLRPNTSYRVTVEAFTGASAAITVTTESKPEVKEYQPPIETCPLLTDGLTISGYKAGVQCQRLDATGVAHDELRAQGIVDAVDVWGTVDSVIRICFHSQGTLKFLDAATSPRALSGLASENIAGMTCGSIDRAGTVVLVQLYDSVVADEQAGEEEVVEEVEVALVVEAAKEEVSLQTTAAETAVSQVCQLATSTSVSLRSGPSVYYKRILVIPTETSLVASAQANGWFLTDFEGAMGWVSGDYVESNSVCAAIEASDLVFLDEVAEASPGEPDAHTDGDTAPRTDCRLTAGDIINLRSEPGMEYSVLAEIPFRARFTSLERLGDWFQVEFEGQMGWVNAAYVFQNGICG